jgi:hypothetical protein
MRKRLWHRHMMPTSQPTSQPKAKTKTQQRQKTKPTKDKNQKTKKPKDKKNLFFVKLNASNPQCSSPSTCPIDPQDYQYQLWQRIPN